MSFFILVKNGEDAGIRFKIQSGLKLGRKETDYIIKDTAASSLHAQIHEGVNGEYLLFDCKSKNGTKINEIREDVITLTPGLIFTIGTTDFQVVSDLQSNSTSPNLSEPPPNARRREISRQPSPAKIKVVKSWHQELESFSTEAFSKIKNQPQPIKPMNPALKLIFITGVQTDTEWILGYGPRKIGADEYDLTIFEPEAPGLCFELIPNDFGVSFKTNHSEEVLYNGRTCDQSLLKDGDLISIGKTKIRIELIE